MRILPTLKEWKNTVVFFQKKKLSKEVDELNSAKTYKNYIKNICKYFSKKEEHMKNIYSRNKKNILKARRNIYSRNKKIY